MTKAKFGLRNRRGGSPVFLHKAAGRYRVDIEDEDGTPVFSAQYDTEREALDAMWSVAKQLRELRLQHTGVESLEALRQQYRKAKRAADEIRDRFVAAKALLSNPQYAAARAAIKP